MCFLPKYLHISIFFTTFARKSCKKERMSIDWRKYWEKIKEFGERLRVIGDRLQAWVIQLWQRVSAWYLAQQEIVKTRSEVSHERLTVKRAVLLFMETWGLGSRNIFYTMWHLIWRPGYMIGDYLNGRRSRYMQPFFMFFVLTLILVQMAWALDVQLPKNRDMTMTAYQLIRDHSTWFSPEQRTTILNTAHWLDKVHDWRDDNRAWDLIIHSIGVCLITWLLWRKSPRIGQGEWVVDIGAMVEGYNFAEIVTAITYILCQIQLLSMVAMLCFRKLPFDHIQSFMLGPELILFVILLIDFKQLFQRSWWDTAWRTALIMLFV